MKFHVNSNDGDGLGIARRLLEEGHSVTASIRNKKAKSDYDNLLTKVEGLQGITTDTTVVFDSSGGGKTADRLRGQGFPVVGSSMFADQLELDRHTALGLMEDAGIKVPPSRHFTDWQEGIAYVESIGNRMCFKSDNNKLISYVSSCAEDMIEHLQLMEKTGEQPDYELQDFVKGMEISTEGWFDGFEFAKPLNHTFEKKQLMNDDLGASSGCAGNIVWACMEEDCKICREGLMRFEGTLRHHNYSGMIDLNAIVNDEGVWGLEFTPRTGFDAFPALMEMLTVGVGDLLNAYARGERISKFPMATTGFGAGIRVTIPPYPFDEADAPKGVAIRGLVRADRPHSYFYNVFLDKEGQLRSSGAYGAIAVFTGYGDTIYYAMEKAKEICDRCDLPNKQYRTDLDRQFEQSYGRFKSMVSDPHAQDQRMRLDQVSLTQPLPY